MASCSKCGVNVGCGCQLYNGLCSTCYNLSQMMPPPPSPKPQNPPGT